MSGTFSFIGLPRDVIVPSGSIGLVWLGRAGVSAA